MTIRAPSSVLMSLLLATLAASSCGEPAITPDAIPPPPLINNGLIAYPERDSQGRQQIFTIRADATGRRQLTFEGDSGLPSWLPDGGQLFSTSIRRDPTTQELRPGAWVMDADGANQREILPYAMAADGSPDGTQIAYVSAQEGGIWTADADGNNPVQLTLPASGASQIHPTWSWDGTRIAYVHVEPDTASAAGFHPEIWVMNADGTNKHQLTVADPDNLDANGNKINTAHDANAPDWSPTDERIAFWSGEEGCCGQIWVINADGTGRKQLTEAPLVAGRGVSANNDDPAWSPDGNKILFSTNRSGTAPGHEMWVMDADGTNELRIANAAAVPLPGDAAWQPVRSTQAVSQSTGPTLVMGHSGRIAFSAPAPGGEHIFTIDARDGIVLTSRRNCAVPLSPVTLSPHPAALRVVPVPRHPDSAALRLHPVSVDPDVLLAAPRPMSRDPDEMRAGGGRPDFLPHDRRRDGNVDGPRRAAREKTETEEERDDFVTTHCFPPARGVSTDVADSTMEPVPQAPLLLMKDRADREIAAVAPA